LTRYKKLTNHENSFLQCGLENCCPRFTVKIILYIERGKTKQEVLKIQSSDIAWGSTSQKARI